MTRVVAWALPLLLATTVAAAQTPPFRDEQCYTTSRYEQFAGTLDNVRTAIAERHALNIVALGSSMTQGTGSDRPETDYPSRLQEELSERFPSVTIQVWNRGIGGQTARDMLERLDTDVLDLHPDLVIWQTGINDAIEDVPTDEFKDTLTYGIELMRDRAVDTILMDMQYSPALSRLPNFPDYRAALRAVASEEHVPLFSQFDVMRYWVKSGDFDLEELLSNDGLHMVDVGYHCLAVELSDAIKGSLR